MRLLGLFFVVALAGCQSALEAGWSLADAGEEERALSRFARALADADAAYRRVAARELLARGERCLPYLLDSLRASGPYHDLFYAGERADAAWALGLLGSERAVEPLLDAVARARAQRRESTVLRTLAALRGWNGMRLLLAELGAARAGKAERAEAKAALLAVLFRLEEVAAQALSDGDRYYTEPELLSCIERLRALPGEGRAHEVARMRAAETLEKELLREMRRHAPVGMPEAVRALGLIGDARAVPVLVGLLEETAVADEAAVALLRIGDGEGIRALRERVGAEPERWWPLGPALSLPGLAPNRLPGKRELRLLQELGEAPPRESFESKSPYLRIEALRALARAQTPPAWASEVAASLLDDPIEDVAVEACSVLGALGAREYIPELRRLLDHESRWVAAAAARALVRLGGPDPRALAVAREVAFRTSTWGRRRMARELPEGCRALGVPADDPLTEKACIRAIERYIATRPEAERRELVLGLRDPEKVYYGAEAKRPFDRTLPPEVLRSRAEVVRDPALRALLLALAELRGAPPVDARVLALGAIAAAGPAEEDVEAAEAVAGDPEEPATVRWWARVVCGRSRGVGG